MRELVLDNLTKPAVRDPGPEPVLDWLPIDKLCIDPEYQREIGNDGRRNILRIATAFEWTKFSPVVVPPVSLGRFAIIDGQHRTTAAKLCGFERVPCLVLLLDRAGQAASFAAINGSVTRITPFVIFRAALAAGEGWAVQAQRVAVDAGCKVMTFKNSTHDRHPGEIYGINTLRDLIARHGEAAVTTALKAYKLSEYGDLAEAWGTMLILAWVSAVAGVKGAAALSVTRLAKFHDDFDILETEDLVAARLREARRIGQPALAHWAALTEAISTPLTAFVEKSIGA